ncbi:MAG: 50S ribosomal protein L32 [Oscillospiraceae bacterium]|jgi:large subunit ribosomal protein L32|nr:50S ribosomal protein L32 [Oscillospiraceae bacterium]
MALPKGKISKSRGRLRRTHWKLSAPGIVKCPRCQQMKLSHRICKHCGYYDGKQVIVTDDAAKGKKKEKEA